MCENATLYVCVHVGNARLECNRSCLNVVVCFFYNCVSSNLKFPRSGDM